MSTGFSRLKPGVKRRTHLLLSAFLWTAIGCLLLAKGWLRLDLLHEHQFILVITAFAFGCIKSRLVLDRAARKAIDRILVLKDGTCLGAVYSFKTWALVLCMMGMGVILRNSSLPAMLICFISLTIGCSLLLSSRLAWIAWFNSNPGKRENKPG